MFLVLMLCAMYLKEISGKSIFLINGKPAPHTLFESIEVVIKSPYIMLSMGILGLIIFVILFFIEEN